MGKTNSWYVKAEGIEVSFQERLIFTLDQFELYKGDRVGIVGLNGSGKTTLLNILYGEFLPQKGFIKQNATISYFRQFEEADIDSNQNGKLKKEFQIEQLEGCPSMSGGENTRVRLADVLAGESDVIFVDEPTSNLDIKGITLLKEKLGKRDTFLIITHDRALLSMLCNRIMEVEDQKVTLYEMGYEKYQEVKAEDVKRREREYEGYINERARLQSAYQGKKQKAADIGKRPKNISAREARLRNFLASRPYDGKQLAMERQAKAVQSRIDHLEVKEKPKQLPGIHIDFTLTNPPENRRILKVEHLNCSYGTKEVLRDVTFSIKNRAKVAITGGNGAGKTTLLNAIIKRQKGVSLVPRAKLGYFYQQFEQLVPEKTVLENVMQDSIQKEETARTILARLLLPAQFINKPVETLSGGEKGKLAIAKLLVSDANVLILDEPTNYLDMPSVQALTEVLMEYEGTILFVSHDEAFIHDLATGVLVIENKRVEAFEGTLQEYCSRKDKSAEKERVHMQIQALEMRVVELISRLSVESGKEELEREYQQTIEQLSKLRKMQ